MTSKRAHAAKLLRRYDKLKAELLMLEPELNRACADYGRDKGVWGFRPEHLRIELTTTRNAA